MIGITRRQVGALLAAGTLARPALAQPSDFPNRPVRVVCPYGPGGATDTQARIFSQRLSQLLGQPFPVENRPGAGTAIGAEQVLRAPRDGYTIMFAAGGAILATPRMQTLTYDPARDFTGISMVGSNGNMLAVARDFPARTIQEFVAYGKANPGKLNGGHTGNGTSSHLATVLINVAAGLDITPVAYAGVPQIIADLIAGRLQLHFGSPADILPQVQAGNLRVLAGSGERRARDLPDVPTVNEVYGGGAVVAWNAFFAPTGTPRPAIDLMARHLIAASREPEVIARLQALGIEQEGSTPEAVQQQIERETPLYERLLTAAGLRRT
ncbi:Bug family tripartite tricarboxylate transporter substrate binding protein [Falsiroseomonas sp. HW251]|uniref:Bug family tripartite tricarboxylate transporter substrate binding protein n=1 Tax=Falsiroseomonas sp. HW251 TaxID=3390998 RepID=UPI003D32366F